ncbi:MAG: hypothetical protein R8G01_00955 [Ilumatobacteraceae bacterium]|nr:hypothetical protein [Ilumatobacteraceae bacterium]
MRTTSFVAVALGLLAAACGGSGGDAGVPGPRIELIPDAVAAIEDHYGAPQEYFEISAGLDAVGFVVAVDEATMAEQGSYGSDGTFVAPEPVGEASGETFFADQIDFDPDLIFEQVREELDDPVIVDLAIQGGPNDTVVYDASIASDGGGVLLVLLGPDGTIQGAQGQ